MALYITFTKGKEKVAVCCKDMGQATEVGSDACSLAIVKNVRLRKRGKPSNRQILSYNEYWKTLGYE